MPGWLSALQRNRNARKELRPAHFFRTELSHMGGVLLAVDLFNTVLATKGDECCQ